MITSIISKVVASILIPVSLLAGIFAPKTEIANLGATGNEIPTSIGLFETTLASAITSSATSFTLTSATYNNGASTIASSTYLFVADEGSSNQEFILADCTGINCSNAIRGVDRLTGTTTVASLQYAHRRGASIKITDASILQISRILNGIGKFPNKLSYASVPTLTADTDIATKKYADDLSFAGAPDASVTVKGLVEIATQTEIASSSSTGGTTAPLVITSQYATSTYNSATAALRIPVTQNDGKLDQGWLDLSESFTFTGSNINTGTNLFQASTTFTATTTILADSLNHALVLNGVPYSFQSTRGASSTVPFEDGNGNIKWQEPTYSILLATAASTTAVKYSANTERSTASDTYELLKSIQIRHGGQINVSFALKYQNGSGQARIYVNGIAIGTERSASASYVYYDENINVKPYDYVQLYALDASGGGTDLAIVKDFRIFYTKSLSGDGSVITD